jgi:predicted lysophospholipase L1 biosynthesis ABC-type transport system permease subunit
MSPGSSSGRHFASARTTTPSSDGSQDWPAQAADAIERAVGSVRDKTTGPAITVARWIVYGTFALVVGSVVGVLVAIAGVRALDNYLPDSVFGEEHTWAAHLVVGAVFTLAGMLLWSKRSAPVEPD